MFNVKLLNPALIVINMDKKSKYDVMRELANLLVEQEAVKPSYLQALVERENIYPTGLQTKDIGVAIPHADVKHVLKPSIAIATMKNSVQFNSMANPSDTLDVKMIFMLALKEPKKQLQLLQDLVVLFQSSELIEKMLKSNDAQTFIDVVNQIEQNG
ncbi:MAG: phosphoenolpyruvate-dependent sugar phosphotransferase system 2 [Firmicutes bacterium]|nr:phosphoenolpyruvate-dependent sugar phosphotransferase system 2 [Bacillota bacterium]